MSTDLQEPAVETKLSPQDAYQLAKQAVAMLYLHPEELGDWTTKHNLCPSTMDEAIEEISKMLESVGDPYTVFKRSSRQSIMAAPAAPSLADLPADEPLPAVLYGEAADGIGYLRIVTFMADDLIPALMQSLSELRHCKAFILDLRHNTGGPFGAAVLALQLLMSAGELGSEYERKIGDKLVYQTKRYTLTEDSLVVEMSRSNTSQRPRKLEERLAPMLSGVPFFILIDGLTASSAEIFAGVMQENGMATLIGTRTYGKSYGQYHYELDGVGSLRITNSMYLLPDGKPIGNGNKNGNSGLLPDIVMEQMENEEESSYLGRLFGAVINSFGKVNKS